MHYASNPCNFRITENIQSPFPPIDEDHLCLCKGDSLPGRNAERWKWEGLVLEDVSFLSFQLLYHLVKANTGLLLRVQLLRLRSKEAHYSQMPSKY